MDFDPKSESLHTPPQTIFDVPWYLYPLENLIQRHVHKSFEDYVDIIHNHLCDHSVD